MSQASVKLRLWFESRKRLSHFVCVCVFVVIVVVDWKTTRPCGERTPSVAKYVSVFSMFISCLHLCCVLRSSTARGQAVCVCGSEEREIIFA